MDDCGLDSFLNPMGGGAGEVTDGQTAVAVAMPSVAKLSTSTSIQEMLNAVPSGGGGCAGGVDELFGPGGSSGTGTSNCPFSIVVAPPPP